MLFWRAQRRRQALRWMRRDTRAIARPLQTSSYHALRTEEKAEVTELVEREQPLAQLTEHLRQTAVGHGRRQELR